MNTPLVLFMGGNGHCTARLERIRDALDTQTQPPFVLREVHYPGFEGRPKADSFDGFLDATADHIAALDDGPTPAWIHATGIGGLLALTLRAQGRLLEHPMMFQAPVLWGLENRRFPKLMRFGPARATLQWLFAQGAFQRWFVRRQFETPISDTMRTAFFEGYAQCSAMTDFFTWLTPGLLRQLEEAFAKHPERLDKIVMLWGGQDAVVTLEELQISERALGHQFERRTFDDWGHYPLIDAPQSWVKAVANEVTP